MQVQSGVYSIEEFPVNKIFDVVRIMDVLEHLVRPEEFLARLRKSLPSVTIIVTVPNVAYWYIRLKLLIGWWSYSESSIMDRTHLRWFTRSAWRTLIEEAGYVVSLFECAEGMLPKENWIKLLGIRETGIERLRFAATSWVPSFFGAVFLFNAEPRKR